MAGLPALMPGLRRAFAVVCEISATLLATLAAGLGCAFAIISKISAALLTAVASGLGCSLTILSKVAGTAAMFRFGLSHHLILS
jgi:hypothetical protein